MRSTARRWLFCLVAAAFILYSLVQWHDSFPVPTRFRRPESSSTSKWRAVQNTRYPLERYTGLPKGKPLKLPDVQAPFKTPEFDADKKQRLKRLQAVKDAMIHSWKGYKAHAWLKDEVAPLSASYADRFSGWGATLVDSLDTLWIMDMKDEFREAVEAVSHIDFSTSTQREVSVFETTIRYLGGFLSAYDLSGEQVLLDKAVELGEMLYVAFDTANRLPVLRWDWKAGLEGLPQEPSGNAVAAEVGSLTMEFTRLAQITGDVRYYDAVDRISRLLAAQQGETFLPGLWPVWLDAKGGNFTRGREFTIGALTDSMFEYLPKMHALLGGREPIYQEMYEMALPAMEKHIFFRPLNPENKDILFPGRCRVDGSGTPVLNPSVEHLGCFIGGMVGIGGKLFEHETDVTVARKLTDGCIWAYETSQNGVMPEIFAALPCDKEANPQCLWEEELWLNASMQYGANASDRGRGIEGGRDFVHRNMLAPGFVQANDRRYLLRPEAIESVFVLYRMTADKSLQDHGWDMFQATVNITKTDVAHAAVADVTIPLPKQEDSMESFWTAETLKYYYLLFSDPDVVSLDEYVLNTEAHPFKRPAPGKRW